MLTSAMLTLTNQVMYRRITCPSLTLRRFLDELSFNGDKLGYYVTLEEWTNRTGRHKIFLTHKKQ